MKRKFWRCREHRECHEKIPGEEREGPGAIPGEEAAGGACGPGCC